MKMLRLVVLLSFPSFVFCSCPTGTAYESTFNKCYAYVSNPTGYLVAEEYCISLGGHLVSIDSAFENTYLVGFAAGAQSHWIGLNYLMYPSWFWSDNSTSQFRAWGASSPADISVYQCAAVSHATNYWTWICLGSNWSILSSERSSAVVLDPLFVLWNRPILLQPPLPLRPIAVSYPIFGETEFHFRQCLMSQWLHDFPRKLQMLQGSF